MAQKYKFVRMPRETYDLYKNVQCRMKQDLRKVTGKEIKLPMTKVFKAVVSPSINENYIQVSANRMICLRIYQMCGSATDLWVFNKRIASSMLYPWDIKIQHAMATARCLPPRQ